MSMSGPRADEVQYSNDFTLCICCWVSFVSNLLHGCKVQLKGMRFNRCWVSIMTQQEGMANDLQVFRQIQATAYTRGLAYDPDSSYLAAASADGQLTIWNIANGKTEHSRRKCLSKVLQLTCTTSLMLHGLQHASLYIYDHQAEMTCNTKSSRLIIR